MTGLGKSGGPETVDVSYQWPTRLSCTQDSTRWNNHHGVRCSAALCNLTWSREGTMRDARQQEGGDGKTLERDCRVHRLRRLHEGALLDWPGRESSVCSLFLPRRIWFGGTVHRWIHVERKTRRELGEVDFGPTSSRPSQNRSHLFACEHCIRNQYAELLSIPGVS